MKIIRHGTKTRVALLSLLFATVHFALLVYFSLLAEGTGWAINVAELLSFPANAIEPQMRKLLGSFDDAIYYANSACWGLLLSLAVNRVIATSSK